MTENEKLIKNIEQEIALAETVKNDKIIGSYYGTVTAEINKSGTQVLIKTYVDISQIPEKTAKWLQEVYASPGAVTIQKPPPGYEPDLPKRGAPKKSDMVKKSYAGGGTFMRNKEK